MNISKLEANEVIGDLIQVKPNYSAQSIIEITEEYVFQKHVLHGGIFYLLKLIHYV